MDYLYIICIALLIFFSASLFLKKGKTLSEKIFTGWLVLLIMTELSFFLYSLGLYGDYFLLFEILCGTHILHGPILYFYSKSFINSDFRFRSVDALHLVPFFVLSGLKYAFNNVFHIMNCAEEQGCFCSDNPYSKAFAIFKVVVLGIYIIWVYRDILNYQKKVEGSNEGLDYVRLNWLKNIIYGVGMLFGITTVYKVVQIFGIVIFTNEMMFVNILVSLFILIFLYIGNTYAYIFSVPFSGESVELDKPVAKYKSGLENDIVEQTYADLIKFMEENKPFLDNNLNISKLSDLTGISTQHISQVINSKTKGNFNDFVNSYRVKYLLEKIHKGEDENYTLLSLAFECGFNSKTTFNRVFKENTGQTPTQYIKNLRKD